jgi:hypothetical protein
VFRVSREDDLGAPGADSRDLPENAIGVDHRFVDEHAVASALIDHEALAQRTGLDTDDLGELPVLDQRRQRGVQAAQLSVLLLERRLAHLAELELALVLAQALVLSAQCGRAAHAVGEHAPA